MWTSVFWKSALERAIKTVAQTMLSLWLVGDVAFNIFTVNWQSALGVGLGAAIASLIMSIASLGIGPADSPSLVRETAK